MPFRTRATLFNNNYNPYDRLGRKLRRSSCRRCTVAGPRRSRRVFSL